MHITCGCRHEFESKELPCPDNIEGCLVSHEDIKSFICPKCGYDSGPDIEKAVAEGRVILNNSFGMGAFNPKGLVRLQIMRD